MLNVPLRPLVPSLAREADRGLLGLLATVLLHAALILAWQMARKLPSPQAEGVSSAVQWIDLPGPAPAAAPPSGAAAGMRAQDPGRHSGLAPGRVRPEPREHLAPAAIPAAPAPAGAAPPAAAETAATPPSEATASALPGGESILESARRSVGGIDRALRMESRPYITAPRDSPQIRMRKGMDEAHAMAPPRLWEAPKLEELVNNTGDGARRTRVITGHGTYCVTERAPVTSIDMIEKHGKQRFTNCPEHEEPARKQEWHTARD